MIEYKVKVHSNGDKKWYLNGKLHREDGPAFEFTNGNKKWYLNGKLHREDGPAIEFTNGNKEYWLNGKRHRENGPAIERHNSYKEYWLNGKLYTEEDYKERLKKLHPVKELTVKDISDLFGYDVKIVK